MPVQFRFDAAWDGLAKIVTFSGSGVSADVALTGTSCAVPSQCLTTAGGYLTIGVRGALPDGTIVTPTVIAIAGAIHPGSAPSGFDPAEPAPSWSAQVQAAAASALEKASAVEEAAARGDFDGEDGKSAYQTAVEGGYTGTAGEFAEKLAAPYPEEVFWATYGETDAETIYTEMRASKLVLCAYNNLVYTAYRKSVDGGPSIVRYQAFFKTADAENSLTATTYHNYQNGSKSTNWASSELALAPLASPTFIGTPKAPTAAAGTNTKQVATTEFVNAAAAAAVAPVEALIPDGASSDNKLMDTAAVNEAIAAAVAGITSIGFEVVQSLPASGTTGTIYLVSHGGSEAQNIYDEYIWLGSTWELLGTTEIDLTGYATQSWVQQQGYGSYSKPSGGIPASDMAAAVQTSLDKADTALQSHQDISGKADKVSSPTSGNFAALDANGNLADSGHKHSDYLTEHQSLAAYRTASAQDGIDAGKVSTADYAPVTKTGDMTQQVGKDAEGKLWTAPGSGGSGGLTILSYGSSTWADFLAAYSSNKIVYCRASSASDPGSGNQTRHAFLAYVDNPSDPTSAEFQYYRSMSSHTANQQGDQVYIYKLVKSNGGTWSFSTREVSSKIAAGTGLSASYSNGTLTLSAAGGGGAGDAVAPSSGTASGTSLTITDALAGKVISATGTAPVTVRGRNISPVKELSGVWYAQGSFGFNLPAGTYTITALCTSSKEGETYCKIQLGGFQNAIRCNTGSRTSVTLTLSEPKSGFIRIYAQNATTESAYSVTLEDIVVSTGSGACPYEPYAPERVYAVAELNEIELTAYTNLISSESSVTLAYVKANAYTDALLSVFRAETVLTYLTPEEFGAVGDGYADDTSALNACIEAAAAAGRPVRAFGKYRTTGTVSVDGDNLDLYINRIDYAGSSYAVKYQGQYSRIVIGSIISQGHGFYAEASARDMSYNTFYLTYINAHGNCFWAHNESTYSCCDNRIFFDRFASVSPYSCIYNSEGDGATGVNNEWTINGGYLYGGLWGIRGMWDESSRINARTENLGTENVEGGGIWSTNGRAPRIEYVRLGELARYNTWLKLSGTLEKPFVVSTPQLLCPLSSIDITELQMPTGGHKDSENTRAVTNIEVQKELRSEILLTKHLVIWGPRFQFPQEKNIVYTVDANMDMRAQYYNDVIPQTFIAAANATIYLHPTYASNCLSKFRVVQENGYKLTIYDCLGNLVFDGSQRADGRYEIYAYTTDDAALKWDLSNQSWGVW